MKKVLLLDTDLQQMIIMETFLQKYDIELLCCKDLEQLEKQLKSQSIDLILLNSLSPKLNKSLNFKKLLKTKLITKYPFLVICNNEDWKTQGNKNNNVLSTPINYYKLLEAIECKINLHKHTIDNDWKENNIRNIAELKLLMARNFEAITLKKDSVIFKQQRVCSHIYLIEEGLVKTCKMDDYGRELITGVYKENDLFGTYALNKNILFPETAVALKDSLIIKFPIQLFHEILAKNNELTLEFARLLSESIINLKANLLDMAYGSVLKKTSKTLLQLAQNGMEEHSNTINLSRNDLAQVAGISTESLIRSLGVLKKEKLIVVNGRTINVININRLNQIK